MIGIVKALLLGGSDGVPLALRSFLSEGCRKTRQSCGILPCVRCDKVLVWDFPGAVVFLFHNTGASRSGPMAYAYAQNLVT